MDLMKTVAVGIARILTLRVVDSLVSIPPVRQPPIDVILIRVDQTAGLDGVCNDRLNRDLLDVGEHLDHHVTITLDHAENGGLFFLQGASAPRPFQPAATAFSAQLPHDVGLSLMPSNNIDFITFHHAAQGDELFFATIPSRKCVVMTWVSLSFKSNSAAICWFDRFKPIRYKHTIHTLTG
jgi:hypothetical protein